MDCTAIWAAGIITIGVVVDTVVICLTVWKIKKAKARSDEIQNLENRIAAMEVHATNDSRKTESYLLLCEGEIRKPCHHRKNHRDQNLRV